MDEPLSKVVISTGVALRPTERIKNLDHMVNELNKINWYDTEKDMNNVHDILDSYESNEDDLEKFCHWSEEEGYSRNEIITVPNKYSLLLMRWKPSKGTFIHNNCGSYGLVKVLKGHLVEEIYTYNEKDKKGNRLKNVAEITIETNDIRTFAYFNDYHCMYNPHNSDVAVSLHVYAPPMEKCRIIDKKTEITEVIQLNYASKNGNKIIAEELNTLSDPMPVDINEIQDTPLKPFDINMIQNLEQLDWNHPNIANEVQHILKDYDTNHVEWSKYCHIPDDEQYSRTKIYNGSDFTLSLAYYKHEAQNLAHDHGGAKCIFKVLEGKLEEKHFNVNPLSGALDFAGQETYSKNEVNNCEEFKDYHSNRNPSNKEHTITLNVFTSQDVKCRVYETKSQCSYDIGPNFHLPCELRKRTRHSKLVFEKKYQEDIKHFRKKPLKINFDSKPMRTYLYTIFRIVSNCLPLIALVLVFTSSGIRVIQTNSKLKVNAEKNITKHLLDLTIFETILKNQENYHQQKRPHGKKNGETMNTSPVTVHKKLNSPEWSSGNF